MLSAEDDATYTRMEQDITDLGKEIARLERQEALDAELSKPTASPLTGKPLGGSVDEKTGRATDEYRSSFWNLMRSKNPMPQVVDALRIGADTEGGYLVPDEYERTLVEALKEENIFRPMAHIIRTASGDRKIPVLGLDAFDGKPFHDKITAIRAEGNNTLVFLFKDGTQTVKRWSDRSRAESWTPEMRDAAREFAKKGRAMRSCQQREQ